MGVLDEKPSGPQGVPTVPETALASHELFTPGTVVGRYRIVERLATGGMGVVFRAYDPELSRHVALKLVRPSSMDLEQSVSVEEYEQRLLREAQALARLSHPNVVAAFDVGRFAGALFIAMELIDGVSLRAWLLERPRPRAEILELLLEAGRGLSAAHRAGVVHRDFKLSNVMVSSEGRVQVVDFGLARTAGADVEHRAVAEGVSGTDAGAQRAPPSLAELTRTGTIMGTAGYIAPEQLEGGTIDERSDQFSYASAAFTALTGFSAYPSESLAAYRLALLEGDRAAWPKSVPRAVREVIDRGLSRRPDDRYPSIDALLDDLERAARPSRRLTLLVVAAALGLSALASVIAVRERLAQRCDIDERSFGGTWDADRRAQVKGAFESSGNPRAADAFELVATRLDNYRASWQSAKQEACLAVRVRREQSDQILSLRNACLDGKLTQLGTMVQLFEHADAALVDRAPEALDTLAQLRDCSDIAALVGESERLPEEPVRRSEIEGLQRRWDSLQAVSAAGRWHELLEQAQALSRDAEATGYKPIQARAMSHALMALERLGRPDEVRALRQRTLELASEARVYDVLAYQALRLLLLAVDGERIAEARAMLPLVDADVRLAGSPPTLQIRLLTYRAAVLTAEGLFQEAGAQLERALAECRQLGPEGLRSCLTPQRELGFMLAAREDFAGARRELEVAIDIAKRAYGAHHPSLLNEYNNFADIMLRAKDADAALRAVAESRALAATMPENRQTANIWLHEGMALQARGDFLGALPILEEAERRAGAVYGHRTVQASTPKYHLGLCLHQLGRTDEALPWLEQALELRRSLRAPAGKIAESAFGVADALWSKPAERGRAITLGREALALLRSEGETAADEAQHVQAWLDAHAVLTVR